MVDMQIPERLNAYRVIRELGRGSTGVVYHATGPEGRDVALKLLDMPILEIDAFMRRLERQIGVVSRISSPNIVRSTALEWTADRRAFIVMEYVTGKSLATLLTTMGVPLPGAASKPAGRMIAMPVAEVIRILRQMAMALDAACSAGLTHYHLHPGKIMVQDDGVAKVLGFGQASDTAALQEMLAFGGGDLPRMPYRALEVSRGDNLVDVRADLYSLGALAYLMLCGYPPYPGPSVRELREQQEGLPAQSIRKRNRAVPRNLAMVIDRLLANDASQRHMTPADLISDLERIERGEMPATPFEVQRTPMQVAMRVVMFTAAGLTVLAIGYFSIRWWQAEQKVVAAREFMAQRQYDRTLEALAAAGIPDSSDVRRMREDARRGLAFEAAMTRGEALLTDNDFDGAEDAFTEASKIPGFGDTPRVQEALASIEPNRRQFKFDSMLVEARTLSAAGRHAEALAKIEAAMLLPGFADAPAAMMALRAAQADQYRARRDMIMATTRDLLKVDNFDEAERTVQTVFVLPGFGVDADATRLMGEVRIARIRMHLDASTKAEDWESVMTDAQAILKIDPNDFRAMQVLATSERLLEPRVMIRALVGENYVDGATVLVDDVVQEGQTPMVLHMTRGETHNIRVTLPPANNVYFRPAQQEYTVSFGGKQYLTMELFPRMSPTDLQPEAEGKYASLTELAAGSTEAQQQQRDTVNELALPLETRSRNLGMSFRLIPAGSFKMGSPPDDPLRDEDEGPQVDMTISSAFYMGTYEVTQREWLKVMGYNPSTFQNAIGGMKQPVETVGLDAVHEFIDRLSVLEGVPLGTYRLPTEAEWEYACRAGTTTQTYVGDIDVKGRNNAPLLDKIAWYSGNSAATYSTAFMSFRWPEKQIPSERSGPQAVGLKLPNAWGLYDMIGNVWEWCEDYYWLSLPGMPQTDYAGPTSGFLRLNRGGAWNRIPRFCRSANRYALSQDVNNNITLGFRLVRIIRDEQLERQQAVDNTVETFRSAALMFNNLPGILMPDKVWSEPTATPPTPTPDSGVPEIRRGPVPGSPIEMPDLPIIPHDAEPVDSIHVDVGAVP